MREAAGCKNAAALAILHWLTITGVLPLDAFWQALEQKSGDAALRSAWQREIAAQANR